jgi:ppGpp synthetase/RelA/SpoT-type nucleotidyltranferase
VTRLSKSQIDKLGDRLREPDPADYDLRKLNEFVIDQDPVRIVVESVVRELSDVNDAVTSRLKTKTSILEKLRRQRTRLSEMQDIVGVRLVTLGNRGAQDNLVRRIAERWPKHRLYDRREKPQHGYRAVHVVAHDRGRPVEIQVRTVRQHKWAELFEKIADSWGREIRYGGALHAQFSGKSETVRFLQDIANQIDLIEAVEQGMGPKTVGDSFASIERHLDNLRRELLEEP